MKKFLATFLLALAIVVPTLTVEAAYVLVPNFYDITSNRIEKRIDFLGMEQKTLNGVRYTRWNYEVCNGKQSEYISKYVKKCASKYNLQLVGQKNGNWYFRYTGSQAKYVTALEGSFHMHIGISGRRVVVDLAAGMYPE